MSDWAIKKKYAQPFAKGERKKIGSENFVFSVLLHRNFRIADRTLACDFKNAFKIAEKYHAEALCAAAVSYDFTKSENWRRREGSNLRYPFGHTAFRVRRIRPLCHASLNFRRSE